MRIELYLVSQIDFLSINIITCSDNYAMTTGTTLTLFIPINSRL
jgi:hypothetical protein